MSNQDNHTKVANAQALGYITQLLLEGFSEKQASACMPLYRNALQARGTRTIRAMHGILKVAHAFDDVRNKCKPAA